MLSIEPLRSIKLKEPFRNYLVVQSEARSRKYRKKSDDDATDWNWLWCAVTYWLKLTNGDERLWYNTTECSQCECIDFSFSSLPFVENPKRIKINSIWFLVKSWASSHKFCSTHRFRRRTARIPSNLSEFKRPENWIRDKRFGRNCQLLLFELNWIINVNAIYLLIETLMNDWTFAL